MRTIRILVLVLLALASAACGEGGETSARGDAGVEVVASFFPLADAVTRVGGDRVTVTDLTPAGSEPHDLEITSAEVDRVEEADLLVVMGGGFQPALEELARRVPSLVVLDALSLPDEGPRRDPHVWLDPVIMGEIGELVASRLTEVDPDGAAIYRENAAAYGAELERLHSDFEAGLETCERDLIVTAHDAFGWLARRYELRYEPIAGVSPEQEPDPRRLADLADLAEREGVTTIFTETLVSPRVAETLAAETGTTTAVLDPLESPGEGGAGYQQAMRENLAALRAGLGCSG